MPDKNLTDQASDLAGQVKSSFNDAKSNVTGKASELGQKAANTIDANRGSAAGSLDDAATALHDRVSSLPGGEKVAHLANETADKLGATAQYVRTHDTKEMMADVEAFVKSHPGQSLIAAAVIGFLAGRAFSRND